MSLVSVIGTVVACRRHGRNISFVDVSNPSVRPAPESEVAGEEQPLACGVDGGEQQQQQLEGESPPLIQLELRPEALSLQDDDEKLKALVGLLRTGAWMQAWGELVPAPAPQETEQPAEAAEEGGEGGGSKATKKRYAVPSVRVRRFSLIRCCRDPPVVGRVVDCCIAGWVQSAEAAHALRCNDERMKELCRLRIEEKRAEEEAQQKQQGEEEAEKEAEEEEEDGTEKDAKRQRGEGKVVKKSKKVAGFHQESVKQARILQGLQAERLPRDRDPGIPLWQMDMISKMEVEHLTALKACFPNFAPVQQDAAPPHPSSGEAAGGVAGMSNKQMRRRRLGAAAAGATTSTAEVTVHAPSPPPPQLFTIDDVLDTTEMLPDPKEAARVEYLHAKKRPQIVAMMHMLSKIVSLLVVNPAAEEKKKEKIHIVDVGGGRGDFAINIVRLLGDHVRVTVVDTNAPSIAAGEDLAKSLGLDASRIAFVVGKIEDVMVGAEAVDVLVGLHACGGLTDAILRLAIAHRASFLVCPCCFGKHQHLIPPVAEGGYMEAGQRREVLQRLAESKRRDVGVRAMQLINMLRLEGVRKQVPASAGLQLRIRQFPEDISLKNFVLQGIFSRGEGQGSS